MIGVHADPEAHPQHTFLAGGQACQHARDSFLKVRLDRRIDGDHRVLVFDKVAQVAVFLVTDRRFERNRLFGDFHHLANLFERHRQALGHFFRRRLAALLVKELATGADQLVDRFNHVDRNADRSRLVGDAASDRLTDPPRGVGAKLISSAVLELVDRLHQADVALLDQIKELQTTICIFLGDRDDETQIGFNHFLFGNARLALGFLHCVNDSTELTERHASCLSNFSNFYTDSLDRVAFVKHESGPFLVKSLDTIEPSFVELAVHIAVEERLARNFVTFGEA